MSSPAGDRFSRGRNSATPRQTSTLRSSQGPPSSPPPEAVDPASSRAQFLSASSRNDGVHSSSPVPFLSTSPIPGSQANGRSRRHESSPIRYDASSSPQRTQERTRSTQLRSDSSTLFVHQSARAGRARERRGDISSDFTATGTPAQRTLFVDEQGRPVRQPSDAATFSNLDPNTSEADALSGASGKFIWGSTISTLETTGIVKDFLMNFRRKYRLHQDGELENIDNLPADHPGNQKVYIEMMEAMLDMGTQVLNLDMRDLKCYPPTVKLWYQMQDYPDEALSIFDNAIKEVVIDVAEEKMNRMRSQRSQLGAANGSASSSLPPAPSSDANVDGTRAPTTTQAVDDIPDLVAEAEAKAFRTRPFNLENSINLRDLNPKDMDTLISIKGLVIRTTPVIPDMRDAFFQCSVCNTTTVAEIFRGKIAEPSECPREACKSRNSMQIVHNRSNFSDKQVIKLQETPDSVPDGQTPHSVSICAYDELVDYCKAGDRVEITGVFKCNAVRVNPRQRTVKGIFKTYVDACHIQKIDKRRMGIDVTVIEQEIAEEAAKGQTEIRKVSAEEEQKIKETAARADVYELLSRSLAPSIYELDDVKKGILLQMFGGTNKSFEKGGNPKYRGDINVLLCGDPSTAKSQLLQYVHKIAPRGVYTSGKGSSAVGLTAYVTRDPETRQLVLESGALVLSDGGVCCIDEFDKMSDATRSVLHEVMEQQTVSIAKAGIITTLNARTSILASANPIGSKYNPNLPVPQNIDLPPTLLSRFDLVYLVLDRIDEQNDRRLARHLVGMYLEDTPENANSNEVLSVEFLTAYISYARTNIHPKITHAAADELVNAYVEMRKLGEDVRAAERRITATTRQLESMIRLSEAHAKMRLCSEVTAADVKESVRLIKSALKQAATDARTGLIDMGLLTEGTSASERRRKQDLKNAVLALLDELTRAGGTVRYSELAKAVADQSSVPVESEELSEAMRSLQQEGQLQISGDGGRRTIRRVTGVV